MSSNERKPSSKPRACLRCGETMMPSSLGIARVRLTPPGRSRRRKGVDAGLYVCPSCGQVDLVVNDPLAFQPKTGAKIARPRRD